MLPPQSKAAEELFKALAWAADISSPDLLEAARIIHSELQERILADALD